MNIESIHREFGVRISGIDLPQKLDDSTFSEIDVAVNRYSLILFEGLT
jgi:alpha-ketoglutarate-dependent taurine dioxygenase